MTNSPKSDTRTTKRSVAGFAEFGESVGQSRLDSRIHFPKEAVQSSGAILAFGTDGQRKSHGAAAFFIVGDTNGSLLLFNDIAT